MLPESEDEALALLMEVQRMLESNDAVTEENIQRMRAQRLHIRERREKLMRDAPHVLISHMKRDPLETRIDDLTKRLEKLEAQR